MADANWTLLNQESGLSVNLTDSTSNMSMGDQYEAGSMDYDYYNVNDRAKSLLTKPHRILALVIIFVSLLLNLCSLAAIFNTRGRLTSHFRLLISLSISDLFVAVSALLHIVNKVTNPAYRDGYGPYRARLKSRCGFMVIKALNTVGLNITLLNLMGMAIDHYIAILRPLHHTSLMDSKRTTIMITTLWVVAILCGFSDFLSPLWEFANYRAWWHKFNYCEFAWLTKYQEEYTVFAIALTCFVTMLYMYVRIYIRVRRHQRDRAAAPRHSTRQSIHHSKKTLITTLLVLGTFILCWLPMCIFNLSLIIIPRLQIQIHENAIAFLVEAEHYLFDLLLLNGVCDPIIYAVRIREIQRGYRILIGGCCSCLKRQQPSCLESTGSLGRESNGIAMSPMMDEPLSKGQSTVLRLQAFLPRGRRKEAEDSYS